MLYPICTMIFGVDLAHYRVSRVKDWVSVDCGTFVNGLLLSWNTSSWPKCLDRTDHLAFCLYCLSFACFNPLYTGKLFHCYMLDESICHLRGIGS